MDKIINDIELAQKSGAYLSALALALTIPDICNKYDDEITSEKGEAYVDWCNKWIIPLNRNYINGYHYYALRCAYLHSLNADIKRQQCFNKTGDKEKDLIFYLHLSENDLRSDLFLDDAECNLKCIDINCDTVINNMLQAYHLFIKNNPNIKIENKNIVL